MRKISFVLFFVVALLAACSKEDTSLFDVSISPEKISFIPMSGGAIMHYSLPDDKEVMAIRVRYRDAFGQEIMRTGSYACDSLHLLGFNEARQGVKAYVTLCNRNNEESEAVEVSFDTWDSGPIAFFNGLNVIPSWNGFSVIYEVPQNVNGMAHVFYEGKNPLTGEPDTVLINSFTIQSGKDTLNFPLQRGASKNNIIIRTEDFRGYIVKQETFKDVEAYQIEKLDTREIRFEDPEGLSIEDPEYQLGSQYLFDGDSKGEICFGLGKDAFKTYLAGPDCLGKTLFVLDLQEAKQTAEIRMYAMLFVRRFPDQPNYFEPDPGKYGPVWCAYYHNKLPCNVTIYATNDKNNTSSWVKVSHFEQYREIANASRWCERAATGSYDFELKSPDEIRAAEPCYLSLNISATEKPYRYFKVVVDDVYAPSSIWDDQNPNNFVTLHEVEVYTKKD